LLLLRSVGFPATISTSIWCPFFSFRRTNLNRGGYRDVEFFFSPPPVIFSKSLTIRTSGWLLFSFHFRRRPQKGPGLLDFSSCRSSPVRDSPTCFLQFFNLFGHVDWIGFFLFFFFFFKLGAVLSDWSNSRFNNPLGPRCPFLPAKSVQGFIFLPWTHLEPSV